MLIPGLGSQQHPYGSSEGSVACREGYCGTGHPHHHHGTVIVRSTFRKVKLQRTTNQQMNCISILVISKNTPIL